MLARESTANPLVDLFYGATRGVDIVGKFVAARIVNREVALRIALWIRDARGGSGERQLFRDIVSYLEAAHPQDAIVLVQKAAEIGRWDDLLGLKNPLVRGVAYALIAQALKNGNGLCAKWMPRKGEEAVALRNFMRLSPKTYRKLLVESTNVVETEMCAGDWDAINFNHVPSVAHARYKRAFGRNTTKYGEWVTALKNREAGAKVNAAAVYPYDVLKGRIGVYATEMTADEMTADELAVIEAQWAAMPNFVGSASVLPLVDVSGSMTCLAGGRGSRSGTTCLEVAVSLGLYFADKNRGAFKDCFLTFSDQPQLVRLRGNINEKIDQMSNADWGMNTNLHAALDKILQTAVDGGVPQSEMPGTLVIFSDMQFDQCVEYDDSAMNMIQRKYQDAGYTMPRIVFWNLSASYGNVPVKFDESGTALVSGFSPAIAQSLLSAGDEFTPESVMMRTIMNSRYDLA
jgi:hypothetical protein